jgi:FtsH-binding integral membrane protein
VKRKIIVGLSIFALLGIVLPVLARIETPTEPVTGIEDLLDIINRIATWLFAIVLAIAVIVLLIAGLNWVTSGGDEEKVASARKMLTWALVGIAIAFLAKGLIALIRQLVGA